MDVVLLVNEKEKIMRSWVSYDYEDKKLENGNEIVFFFLVEFDLLDLEELLANNPWLNIENIRLGFDFTISLIR